MDNDLLISCMRLEGLNNDDEGLECTPYKDLLGEAAPMVTKADDNFDDEGIESELGAIGEEDEDEFTPVIDTSLGEEDEDSAKAVDYVGKYVAICPTCLTPLFTDKQSGEVYCPICKADVEIEAAVGKVVNPDDEVVPAVADEEAPEDADIAADAVDDMNADEGELEDDEDKKESCSKDKCKKGEEVEESVDVSVTPDGAVEVHSKDDKVEDEFSAGVCADELVQVDEFDTDSFDDEVTDSLNDADPDEDYEYETVKVVRNGAGLIIEGKVSSKSLGTKSVRIRCDECKKSKNEFKLEGFGIVAGKLFIESTYSSKNKSIVTESMKYKVVTRKNGKAKLRSNL